MLIRRANTEQVARTWCAGEDRSADLRSKVLGFRAGR